MRSKAIVFSLLTSGFLLTIGSSLPSAAQQSSRRDPQALALVVSSVTAMGGAAPTDSVAAGNVQLVAGSKTETGTLRILARGLDQTAERIQTTEWSRTLIYSRGRATEIEDNSAKRLPLELVVTSQAPDFPLVALAAALGDPKVAFEYVALESLDGAAAHHIRFWQTFPSDPSLAGLAEFSARDLWLDAASGLPIKLSYERRPARGAAVGIPVEVFFSDYRTVGGVLYPFSIKKSLNGTPWATITITSVQLDVGLADADFPVK